MNRIFPESELANFINIYLFPLFLYVETETLNLFLASRNEDIRSLRLGAVVTFGAWLPMFNKFHKDKLSPMSKDIKTGPLQTLQVL